MQVYILYTRRTRLEYLSMVSHYANDQYVTIMTQGKQQCGQWRRTLLAIKQLMYCNLCQYQFYITTAMVDRGLRLECHSNPWPHLTFDQKMWVPHWIIQIFLFEIEGFGIRFAPELRCQTVFGRKCCIVQSIILQMFKEWYSMKVFFKQRDAIYKTDVELKKKRCRWIICLNQYSESWQKIPWQVVWETC